MHFIASFVCFFFKKKPKNQKNVFLIFICLFASTTCRLKMYREAVLAPNISIILCFFYPLFFFLSFNSISLLKLEHYCFFKKKPKTKQFPLLASLQDLKNVRKLAFAGIPEEAGLRARYWKVRNMSCLRHASIIIHHTALVVVCVLAVESRGRTTRAEEST